MLLASASHGSEMDTFGVALSLRQSLSDDVLTSDDAGSSLG